MSRFLNTLNYLTFLGGSFEGSNPPPVPPPTPVPTGKKVTIKVQDVNGVPIEGAFVRFDEVPSSAWQLSGLTDWAGIWHFDTVKRDLTRALVTVSKPWYDTFSHLFEPIPPVDWLGVVQLEAIPTVIAAPILYPDGLNLRRRPDAAIWKCRGFSGFDAARLDYTGQRAQVASFADYIQSFGGNLIRVFGEWGVTSFFPLDYADWPARMDSLLRFLTREKGLHVWWTIRTGVPWPSLDDERRYVQRSVEVLRAYPNCLVQDTNEPYQYNYTIFDSAMFAGVLAGRGAFPDGSDPRTSGSVLQWLDDHTPRGAESHRKAKNLIEDARLGGVTWAGTGVSAIAGEPEHIEAWTPMQATAYYRIAEGMGGGGIIHGDNSVQFCRPTVAVNQVQAVAGVWASGLNPRLAAEGTYGRIVEADTLRTYTMTLEGVTTYFRVYP